MDNPAQTTRAVHDVPSIHTTPLATIVISGNEVTAEVDDVTERRICLRFAPFQAVRLATADCFVLPDGMNLEPNAVMEVLSSDWIVQLKRQQLLVDETATFMVKARHFLVPLQDGFLEVVSWGVTWSVATSA